MKKLLCPQCKISNLYVKNEYGNRVPVYVTTDYIICPKNEGETLEGCDLDILFCFGCSWSGSIKNLAQH